MKSESKITLLWASEAKPPAACQAQAPHCSLPSSRVLPTLPRRAPCPRPCPRGRPRAPAISRHHPTSVTQESVKEVKGAKAGGELPGDSGCENSLSLLTGEHPSTCERDPKSLGRTPRRTPGERSGPLNAHHQAGRPGRGPLWSPSSWSGHKGRGPARGGGEGRLMERRP